LAPGVPVKPHAFGVPLTRFRAGRKRRPKQITTYAETAIKLTSQLVALNELTLSERSSAGFLN
jgi:hypothetical protein